MYCQEENRLFLLSVFHCWLQCNTRKSLVWLWINTFKIWWIFPLRFSWPPSIKCCLFIPPVLPSCLLFFCFSLFHTSPTHFRKHLVSASQYAWRSYCILYSSVRKENDVKVPPWAAFKRCWCDASNVFTHKSATPYASPRGKEIKTLFIKGTVTSLSGNTLCRCKKKKK